MTEPSNSKTLIYILYLLLWFNLFSLVFSFCDETLIRHLFKLR